MIKFLWNPEAYIKMLEDYFHDKSMKGHHLKDCWYYFAKFKKGIPKDYEYFIAYANTEEDKARNKVLYDNENNGFEYVCTVCLDLIVKVKDLMIFRKEADKVTESDIALKREQYKSCTKINKIQLISAPVLFVVLLVFEWFFPSTDLFQTIGYYVLIALLTVETAFSFFEHRKFSKEYTSIDQRYPKDKLRLIRVLTYTLAIVYLAVEWEIPGYFFK